MRLPPTRSRIVRIALAAIGALAFSGCGDDKDKIAFDEISRLPPREELVEIELGEFVIPIPIVDVTRSPDDYPPSPIELRFTLVAVAPPKHQSRILYLLDRHRGKVHDEVIRVCRNTGREELLESEWATLKAHLLDAIQPLLGGRIVRRLATPTISRDEL